MIILALILLVIVAVFAVAVVLGNPGVHELSVFRVLIPVTYSGIFFTGVGATVVAVLALILLRIGLRRARIRRKERKQLATGEASGRPESRAAKADGKPDAKAAEAPGPQETETTVAGSRAPKAASSGTVPAPASSLDLDTAGSTTMAERRAMLDETDELTRDNPTK